MNAPALLRYGEAAGRQRQACGLSGWAVGRIVPGPPATQAQVL